MDRWWPVVLLAGCGTTLPCDLGLVAEGLAGTGATRCGAVDAYAGRLDPASQEHDDACMADAVTAGMPFAAAWLSDCALETCHYVGRAYDGVDLYLLEQRVLEGYPSSSAVEVTRCAPDVRERTVTGPAGPVVVRELTCGEIRSEETQAPGACPTR